MRSDKFLRRANAYRRAALLTSSEELAGDLFEIAAVFRHMAADLEKREHAEHRSDTYGAMWSRLREQIGRASRACVGIKPPRSMAAMHFCSTGFGLSFRRQRMRAKSSFELG